MDRIGKNKIGWIVLILLFIILIICLYIRDNSRNRALKNTDKTWAIVLKLNHGSARGSYWIRYKYFYKGKFIVSEYSGKSIRECHENLREGDTVFIRYSISDPETTEMVHCYWNDELKQEWLKDKK